MRQKKILLTIVDTTKDNEMRNEVIADLVSLYGVYLKDNDRALEMANRLPSIKYCREVTEAYYISSDTGYYVQKEIDLMAENLGEAIRHLVLDSNLPNDESTLDTKINMIRTSSAVYKMIYGNDPKYYYGDLSYNEWLISTYQISQGKTEDALDSLEQMCKYAIAYDKAYVEERGKHFSSPFVNSLIYPEISDDFYEFVVHNHCWRSRERLKGDRFDCIRDTERFRAVWNELESHAQ